MNNWVISFGPFRVTRSRRLLERGGEPVHLGSRAFDILAHLLEHPGQVVSHRALLAAAWPGIHVEEGNLRFQITMLRQALGSSGSYIINVPGRGYCLTAPVARLEEIEQPRPPEALSDGLAPLPDPTQLIGRDDAVAEISNLVRAHRIVTVVGAGGIGKTSVAVAAASGLGDFARDRVCFVELGSIEDSSRVADTLGGALGFRAGGDDLAGEIANTFGSGKALIVVDGCEHVIDAVATLIDRIVAATSKVSFLVTSREALRIEFERVYLLEALAAPPIDRDLSATEVLSYPAARLFLERAGPASDVVSPDRSAKLVARICSRLDGLALAIEVAAGQVQFYGMEELAEMLEDGLSLTWRGRRTAPARHQTIVAMLEWSYRLLSEEEKSALRFLSVFSGQFSLEDAIAVADKGLTGIDATFALAQLVSKSFVAVSCSDKGTQYRLLDTTRAYAREKFAAVWENRSAGVVTRQ